MKSTIAYIHGWGGSPESRIANLIAQAFPDDRFVCPHLDYTMDPRVLKNELEAMIAQLFNEADPIIVGSREGGFWADILGATYGLKTVLINPFLNVEQTMRRYDLPESYFVQYQKMRKSAARFDRSHMAVFVGSNDISRAHTKITYTNPTMLNGLYHEELDVTPVIATIRNMIHSHGCEKQG